MDREKKPKARWKTISLRALLLIVLAIALWLGWIVNKAREQREAVAALQKFGGFVHYDWEFVNGPVKVPRGNLLWMPTWGKFTPGAKPWAPDWLRRALGDEYFQSIAHVSLYVDIKKGVASAEWVNMGPADDEELRVGGGDFSERGLGYLRGLTRLKLLFLLEGSQQISDAGLEFLKNMKELQDLSVYGWHVSDEGIAKLRELKNLKTIFIGLSADQQARRNKLHGLLPGVTIE
jgi:hypothetical protein